MILECLIAIGVILTVGYMILQMWMQSKVVPQIELDTSDLVFNREGLCPECYSDDVEVCYVDELFKKGKYGICQNPNCGLAFDLPEDNV